MPDRRTHRGANPEDAQAFSPAWHEPLRRAVWDLSWLLSRKYAEPSALKVVGDRYGLTARQRTAVKRCACSDEQMAARASRQMEMDQLRGATLLIDGYSVLTTIEAALGGGVILIARDGCFRDMASIHGTYRKVEETIPAIEICGRNFEQLGVARATWYFDQPVSNSGRLKVAMAEIVQRRGWDWDIQIVPNPDTVLATCPSEIIVSADSVILDRCGRWANLARWVVSEFVGDAWIVDLRDAV